MFEIITRQEANARGFKRYFTGKPCKRGHVVERYVSTCICCECHSAWSKANDGKRIRDPLKTRTYKIKWAEKNPGKIKEKGRRRYRENRERLLVQHKEYHAKNPEVMRAAVRRRRALRAGRGGIVTATDIREITLLQRNRCARCGCPLKGFTPHADHIVPLSRGGQHHRRNIQMLCPSCNCSKHAADPIDDARRLGRLL